MEKCSPWMSYALPEYMSTSLVVTIKPPTLTYESLPCHQNFGKRHTIGDLLEFHASLHKFFPV